ncbi:hypothetical protein Glove_139g22 [Diversispora epigaea]|uniref:Serine-threonine/tyrosine-protein kinase catalytic domain-containing protein n=1 Tax=Diversispora epigaea TaxID=1348612 RepID=A0A397J2D4_9GLOM|nr:hypothetical protein Glove_139g22 [Diversispora epigaea]
MDFPYKKCTILKTIRSPNALKVEPVSPQIEAIPLYNCLNCLHLSPIHLNCSLGRTGWDNQWKRFERGAVLKKFDSVINKDFLNEMIILLKTNGEYSSRSFYGITKDPETYEYMMVLRYFKDGILRNHLKNNSNNINWNYKLNYLKRLANGFHIVHRDNNISGVLRYDKDLAFKICNRFSPFHTPELITHIYNSDARITHRPTFYEL